MRRWEIGHGDSAISKTVLHMQALTLGSEGVASPAVRVAALDAARGSVKNINEIDHVLAWVKNNIEFRGEHAETLQSPTVTLQVGAGDCDDHSTLIAAMLRSLGYEVAFKTVAAMRSEPRQFSHVYAIVKDKRTGQWKGLDSTVPQSYAGWEPEMIYRSKVYRHRGLLGDAGDDGTTAADVVDDALTPIAQAVASRIQYGGTVMPPLPPARSSQKLPPWVWLAAIGGLILFMGAKR